MDYNKNKREIKINKILNNLDKFVLNFTDVLKKYTDYVIVSGYVSILLGRTRATEDVDLLIPYLNKKKFKELFRNLEDGGLECMNTSKWGDAFEMLEKHAIRFFRKGKPVPNIEFKIIKNDLDKYSYDNKIKVNLKKGVLFISPIELQIAYKLFLAADGKDEELQADKDIEDARHLYKIFEEKINKEELISFISKLGIKKRIRFLK